MPKLLPIEIKNDMIDLLHKGVSINKISKELNLAKSTIYHHYKRINGKKFIEPYFESNLSKNEGELLGIVIGDGSLMYYKKHGKYRTTIFFGKININYAKYVKEKFEEFLNKKLKIYNGGEHAIRINMDSKKVYLYFKEFLEFEQRIKHSTVKIKNLSNLPSKFKIGILRGLIDTDGCVSREKKTGRLKVQFFTTSKILSYQFKQMVEEFGFKCGVYSVPPGRKSGLGDKYCSTKECFSVFLYKKEVIPFIKLIKPYKAKKWGLID